MKIAIWEECDSCLVFSDVELVNVSDDEEECYLCRYCRRWLEED